MKVLIVGVNGFLGNAITRRLGSKTTEIFGVSRSAKPDVTSEITYLCGNRSAAKEISSIVKTLRIDVLVDIIPMTLEDTEPLIREVDGRVDQYVMISSSDVYRNYELFQRKDVGEFAVEAVDETSALRRTRYPYREEQARAPGAPDRYLDDYDKLPIERLVQEMRSHWTIVRLPMVYGPGDKQRRFLWAAKPMTEGKPQLLIPRSWANWYTTYGYIDDVAAGVALTVGNPKALERVFNIGEAPIDNQLQWALRIASIVGWRGDVELSDDPQHPFARRIAGLDLSVPFRISSRRIREELGYKEITDPAAALTRTVASYREAK